MTWPRFVVSALFVLACQRDRTSGLPGAEPFEAEVAQKVIAAKGSSTEKFTNRLILERSPYLLQHAHNPVDWRPWGDDALAAAKRLDRPILLSIGYSTCHWCHVMERESFEDPEIAAAINRGFIAVKVDREERPDLDRIYMAAVQRMTGSGGWPLTVVLLPDGRPFFGGTYFPPRDGERGRQKGLLSMLAQLSAAYRDDGDKLVQRAAQLIAELDQPAPRGDVPGSGAIETAVAGLAKSFDATWGGWGRAPKFPRPAVIELLLHHHRRTGNARSLEMATRTLERIAGGGIHDQIGGGFHRYTVDDKWRVPHFEKMLYDNAQLATAFLAAHQATGRDDFAEVARSTLDYLLREMQAPAGGFHSATDADSDGEEGTYYVWTAAELDAIVGVAGVAGAGVAGAGVAGAGVDARIVREYFDVTVGGNFERGTNILWRRVAIEEVAARLALEPAQVRATIERLRPKLLAARAKRTKPFTDTKVLVAWNALAITALARAALTFDDARYRDAARSTATYLLEHGRRGGALRHAIAGGDAFLDDHAFLVAALIDLYEADPDPKWLREAIALQRAQDAAFFDPQAGYSFTAKTHEQLVVRDRVAHDDAVPSGSSVAAENLLKLYELTSDEAYRTRATATFTASGATLARTPGALPRMLAALDFSLDKPKQIVIVSPVGGSPDALLARVRRAYVPNRVLVRTVEGAALAALSPLVPLVEGKVAKGGQPTAYVCVGTHCEQPTSDPEVLTRQLARAEPLVVTP
ncbi:MAG: thioredoxin domain-containing protein [Deltaproteobacteria bacterium]|nr:thioredoxin domain-containing protein [Deltaproteobacteria bacterium]